MAFGKGTASAVLPRAHKDWALAPEVTPDLRVRVFMKPVLVRREHYESSVIVRVAKSSRILPPSLLSSSNVEDNLASFRSRPSVRARFCGPGESAQLHNAQPHSQHPTADLDSLQQSLQQRPWGERTGGL